MKTVTVLHAAQYKEMVDVDVAQRLYVALECMLSESIDPMDKATTEWCRKEARAALAAADGEQS